MNVVLKAIRKTLVLGVTIAFMTQLFTVSASASDLQVAQNMKFEIDGTAVDLGRWQGSALMVDAKTNRTFLPVRALVESVGGTVDYKQTADGAEIDLIYGENHVRFILSTARGSTAYHNGQLTEGEAIIQGDRTYAPIRLVIELFGIDVHWDDATRKIMIETSNNTNNNPTNTNNTQSIWNFEKSQSHYDNGFNRGYSDGINGGYDPTTAWVEYSVFINVVDEFDSDGVNVNFHIFTTFSEAYDTGNIKAMEELGIL